MIQRKLDNNAATCIINQLKVMVNFYRGLRSTGIVSAEVII